MFWTYGFSLKWFHSLMFCRTRKVCGRLCRLFRNEKEARIFGDALRQRMNKVGLTISEEKSKIMSSDDVHANVKEIWFQMWDPLIFWVLRISAIRPKRQIQTWTKDLTQEFTNKMKDYERMVKAYPKSCDLKEWWKLLGQSCSDITYIMELAATLDCYRTSFIILWGSLSVDKQTKPKEKLQMGSVY